MNAKDEGILVGETGIVGSIDPSGESVHYGSSE